MRIQQASQNLATFCAMQLNSIAQFSEQIRQQQAARGDVNPNEPPTTL
jgi:hypothetical protein